MTRRTFQRVTTVVLIGAVIGGAALVGARAWAQGSGGMHAGMMKRMISAALDEALDQAAVSAEQRTAIHASRDGAFAAFETNRPDRRAQMEQRHHTIRDAVAQAIVEIHDTLTPAQRQIVANYARTFGPHGMR